MGTGSLFLPVYLLLLVRKTFPKASGDFSGHVLLLKPVISKGEIGLLQLAETSQIISERTGRKRTERKL